MQNSFKKYIEESNNINKKFKRQWDINTRMVNLTEEVGELAHAVLIEEKKKNDGTKPTIPENLTNLMYELFLIAAHYKIDLDKAWKVFIKTMPGWAAKRNN